MKNYEIYFELFGKKMKTSILATSEDEAKDKLKDKIVFHKVSIEKKDSLNDIDAIFDELMNILKN